jgi:hypothetical protein
MVQVTHPLIVCLVNFVQSDSKSSQHKRLVNQPFGLRAQQLRLGVMRHCGINLATGDACDAVADLVKPGAELVHVTAAYLAILA